VSLCLVWPAQTIHIECVRAVAVAVIALAVNAGETDDCFSQVRHLGVIMVGWITQDDHSPRASADGRVLDFGHYLRLAFEQATKETRSREKYMERHGKEKMRPFSGVERSSRSIATEFERLRKEAPWKQRDFEKAKHNHNGPAIELCRWARAKRHRTEL
jgi:hypothetical protein